MESKRELPPLLVRADADVSRGSGHAMRCVALVEAWCALGGRAFFLSRCVNEVLRNRITAAGARFSSLVGDADLEVTLSTVRDMKAAFVVLDGYDFDFEYQRALRNAGCHLMVIDDVVRLPRYDTDILLNQNFGAARLEYNCNTDATLLLGPKYALLRREFIVWRSRLHTVPETARKILVTLGGSDSQNVTRKVIDGLRHLETAPLQIRVVAGPVNPHIDELRDAAAAFPGRMELFTSMTDMAPLMAWADLAITGAGSTCWELACVGLPAIGLVIAENQRAVADDLATAGVILNLGWHEEVSAERIGVMVNGLVYTSFRRLRMSQRGRALVDGKGADRVAAALWQRTCTQAA
jgi:UDP-2,4-diacetamido-2,4,6-trideoxy-beta-L-altropyranose hydrolase